MAGGVPGRSNLFWALVGSSVLASVGSVPYMTAIMSQVPREGGGVIAARGAFPYAVTVAQVLLFTVPTAWLGLKLAPRAGLSVIPPRTAWGLRTGVLAGLAVGVGLILLAVPLSKHLPEIPLRPPEWWKGLLASVHAGVNEEIWFRLGVMTSMMAAGTVLLRRPQVADPDVGGPSLDPRAVGIDEEATLEDGAGTGRAPSWIFWTANAMTAFLFGALHLPQAAAIVGLTPGTVAWTLGGNVIAGMVFGWLYARRGLLAAIAAHFATDVVLHVIAPLAEL